ncbi:MAG: carboxypeptidase regulatory-like domain-containing protein [Anaerolineae bacterium]
MKNSGDKVRLVLLVISTVALLFPAYAVSAAGPDEGVSGFALQGETPEATYFVLTYVGAAPSPTLVRTLSDLQSEGYLSVVDARFGPGGILLRMTGETLGMLLALEDVSGLTPMEIPPSQAPVQASAMSEPNITPLAGTGAITGTVTAEDTGLPLQDLSIWVYHADTYDQAKPDSYQPDGDGRFTIADLEAGSYKLSFDPWSMAYLDTWYEGQYSWYDATPLYVAENTTTAIQVELAPPARITGTVVAEDSGLPLPDIDVSLRNDTYNIWYSTHTDGDGRYDDDYLPEGTYTVCFSDPAGVYAPECYDDQPYFYDSGDPLVLTVGGVLSGVNASLSQAAALTGTVTDAATGNPVENVTVGAYVSSLSWYPLQDATTDVPGTYRISGLAPGEYKLKFTDNDGVYLESYYDGQETFAAADPVTLTAGMTTTVDMALIQGGNIAGRVVDAETGAGINNTRVTINTLDYGRSFYAWTKADGTYTSPALPSGGYVVNFEPPLPYFDETYDNRTSGYTPVWISAPNTTGSIDAALQTGHVITGTVTGDQGVPLANVHVRPYAGSSSYYDWGLADYTDSDGTYALGPLSSGNYRVHFLTPDSSSYAPEWYNDAITYAQASRVSVPTTGPIDAQLSAGGHISGIVTATDGTPLEDVYIYIYEPGSSASIRSTTTDEEGAYTTGPLPAGNYQLRFSAPWNSIYVSEWHDDQSTQEDAALVSVSAGSTTGHIDAQLALTSEQPPGYISIGTSKASDTGEFLEDVRVYSYTDDPEVMAYHGQCPQDGPLDIIVSPGTYHLYFVPPEPYSPMFYENAYTPTDADPVTVTVDVTTTIASPIFQIGGNVSGTVTAAADGAPLRGTRVEAELQDSAVHAMGGGIPHWSFFKRYNGFADADGRYRLFGLAPGQYRVAFYPPAPYIDAAYGAGGAAQTVSPLAETFIDVNLGETTPDIDAALQEGGVITGVVTAAEDGRAFMGATVEVYDADQTFIAYTKTDMDGVYTTPGLPAGDYKVFFPGPSDYISTWNGDADTFDAAATVSVSAPGTVADVNAALVQGGKVSGYVHEAGTGWPLYTTLVEFYHATDGTLADTTWTNHWGYYESPGLPGDDYVVAFSKEGYLTRWYDDAGDQGSAMPVTLALGEMITGIDVYLDALGNRIFLPLVLRTP